MKINKDQKGFIQVRLPKIVYKRIVKHQQKKPYTDAKEPLYEVINRLIDIAENKNKGDKNE